MTTETITHSERATQSHVIKLIKERLDYTYIGNLKDCVSTNLREDTLRKFLLNKGHSEDEARQAIRKLKAETERCSSFDKLSEVSEAVYGMLRYGTSVSRGPGKTNTTVQYIDWPIASDPKRWQNNIFEIAEEVTVNCDASTLSVHRRPDIVVYVNGIALVVIELKRAGVPVSEAIRQNYRNQQTGYIPRFFTTAQLTMAGNPSEGLWYGTTCTPEKYYLHWKEPAGMSGDMMKEYPMFDEVVNELDRSLLQMLKQDRLLEFIHDCIIYDGGVKKAARPNQYFALKAAQPRIRKRDSGIIWHSQGSGKSLTMVWLAQWIKENIQSARVVIITDRDELDKQITNGLRDTKLFSDKKPNSYYQAQSGSDLLQKLNEKSPWLITTLIHKFAPHDGSQNMAEYKKAGKKSPEQYMQEIADNLEKYYPGFEAKGNIFVFIDECHRTQGGIMNKAMRKIMGDNVMLIGFTGTPLLQRKETDMSSEMRFGRYIHSYRFNEAVDDGVVLDLRYEARNVEKQLSDPHALDTLFAKNTQRLTPKAKEALKDRWAQMQHLYSSREPMQRVVGDILYDMETKDALVGGYGNAMLVCNSIYEAYQYWSIFCKEGFGQHCAVVTSYEPVEPALSQGFTGDKLTQEQRQYQWAKEMMGDRTPEQFEEWAKNKFINKPGEMKLLIVVDKLLTGFDAPSATYLYLDRKLIDHTLFQAICRVNRLNGERKEFGYIIDYRGLFSFIEQSIEDYTNGIPGVSESDGRGDISGFDQSEIERLLKSQIGQAKEELQKAMERLAQLSEPVRQPQKLDDYFAYFCFDPKTTPADEQESRIIANTPLRDDFYNAVMKLSRRYAAIAMQMEEAGYSEQEANDIYRRVKDYDELRHAIMQRSGDYVDMKMYDAQMRSLLDRYITAPRSEKLESLDDFSFLDIISINEMTGEVEIDEEAAKELGGENGVAETMTANVRHVINRKREQNPEEYRKFSERIQRLLEEWRQGVIEYRQFLKSIKEMGEELRKNEAGDPRLDTMAKRHLCDNLDGDVDLAIKVYTAARLYALPGFRENPRLKKQLQKSIAQELSGKPFDVEEITQIIVAHTEEF